jgi:arylsulfatase A-like enzyme
VFGDKLPHIILIVMDTAGAKRCSVYGHHRDTTPGFREMSREATLYSHCFAPAPWTLPSHASLFSGLYASEHGCDEKNFYLSENYHCLSEMLQKLGYRTVTISSNRLLNLNRGFDKYYGMDSLVHSEIYRTGRQEFKKLKQETKNELARFLFFFKYAVKNNYYSFPLLHFLDHIYRRTRGNITQASHYATERSLRMAKKMLKDNGNRQPLFIFINFMETHWRYNPPKSYQHLLADMPRDLKETLIAKDILDFYVAAQPLEHVRQLPLLYEQGLYYLDDLLLDFYHFLGKSGLKDDTLLIITSDHGECFGEHGLWGHFFGVYNELVHIPLLVKYPARYEKVGESRRLVQLHDLMATILEITQTPLPLPESSHSLLDAPRDFAFTEHLSTSLGLQACRRRIKDFHPTPRMQPCRAAITAELAKLIEWADGRLELYDLQTDYDEAHNLVNSEAGQRQAQELKAVMEAKLGPMTTMADFSGPDTDDQEIFI